MKDGHAVRVAYRKEDERASKLRREKREAEEPDKTPIAPSVTAGQLGHFGTASIGSIQAPHNGATCSVSYLEPLPQVGVL